MLQAYFHMCQMTAYSIPANLSQDNILKPHIVLGPRYYQVCSMHARQNICATTTSNPAYSDKMYGCSKRASRHICGAAMNDPADRDKIYACSKCASQHICGPTMSDPANSNKIYGCSKHASRHICGP